MAFRIGLITTLGTNIGDDFIREGITGLLAELFRSEKVEFVAVNKHRPQEVYASWHPVRLAERLPRGRGKIGSLARRALHRLPLSRFDGCDLIVQCGAPVLWPGCRDAEWAGPLWDEVVSRLADRVPVLNLAAGSCFPWEQREAARLEPADADYLRTLLGYCRLTTARDTLAHQLYASLGGEVPLLRCSALLAARGAAAPARPNGLVLVNYMEGAGHYDWGQGVDAASWESTARETIDRLKGRHQVAFVCHNEAEMELAERLDPTLARHLPRTPAEYFELAAGASAALCNRLHASVGMAGLGVPSVAVGTDTRMLMVAALGLPFHYVKDATADQLEAEIEEMIAAGPQERERLLGLQHETRDGYLRAVAAAVG
jgi:hypothetical protein